MKTTWQFRWIQVTTSIWPNAERKAMNHILSTFHKPIGLWLYEHHPNAPFSSLTIEFVNRNGPFNYHGIVKTALGIGEVYLAVSPEDLLANASNPAWVIPQIELGMRFVEEKTGFRSDELNAFIHSLLEKPFPYIHFFEKLARTHKKSGRTFTPWNSFAPNHTEIGVRVALPNGHHRDIVLMARDDLIWLEDDFPMSKTTFRDGAFLILDKNGAVLASIPIEDM